MQSTLDQLRAVVARLRGPDGCPWDRGQTLQSMRPYLLEECHEVLEALDRSSDRIDPTGPADLLAAEELGDLLFVVLLLAQIGEDEGRYSVDQVCAGIAAKMVERHPHVFGGEDPGRAAAIDPGSIAAWENRKAASNATKANRRSRLDGVPRSLPGLLRAHRQGEKAAAVGFDWAHHRDVLAKVREELNELEEALDQAEAAAAAERGWTPGQPRGTDPDPTLNPRSEAPAAVVHELGDLLMAVASLGRHIGAPPEEALRMANDRFAERFALVEAYARQANQALNEAGPAQLDAWWEQAKRDLA
jgi:MazG family protein